MFYRKMFLYAIFLFLINILVLNVTHLFWTPLVFSVIVGLFVNKIYVFYAKKRVSKIKVENAGKDITELKYICSNKGGTSVGTLLLGFVAQFLVSLILLVIMSICGLSSIFDKFKETVESTLNGTYDGMMITNTSIDMKKEFSITVPGQFENDSETYNYEYEYSSGNGVFDTCKIKLFALEGFSDAQDLINQMNQYHSSDQPSTVRKSTINDIDWYGFSLEDSFGKTYYYGTTKNNKAFLLEYGINEDASSDCESYRQQILNSIKRK